jgi:glycosyltransferase involved in cell wall biosynthesis
MRLGIDVQLFWHDHQRAGLHQHVLGLLRGLAALRPRPEVVPYVCESDPAIRRAAEAVLAENGFDLPVRAFRRPRGRPYRLRAWAAAVRSGLRRLDAFLSITCPWYPPSPRRVNAYLIPDLTVLRAAEHHTPANRQHWAEVFAIAKEHGDVVFTYSEHTRQEAIAELGLRPDAVVAAPLAAADQYRPLPEEQVREKLRPLGLEPGGYVLTVGTLEPRKNHVTLFRGYAAYLGRVDARRLPLVVAGPTGWMSDHILSVPGPLGIAELVRFVGRVPDLAALYNRAAAFVYPSLYEGFGLPPLEAMACGTPTIAADATSLPEVVADAGLLVRPDSPTDIADALHRVLTDSALRADLSVRGLKRAAAFSWERTAADYLAALRAAGNRKRAARVPALAEAT